MAKYARDEKFFRCSGYCKNVCRQTDDISASVVTAHRLGIIILINGTWRQIFFTWGLSKITDILQTTSSTKCSSKHIISRLEIPWIYFLRLQSALELVPKSWARVIDCYLSTSTRTGLWFVLLYVYNHWNVGIMLRDTSNISLMWCIVLYWLAITTIHHLVNRLQKLTMSWNVWIIRSLGLMFYTLTDRLIGTTYFREWQQ